MRNRSICLVWASAIGAIAAFAQPASADEMQPLGLHAVALAKLGLKSQRVFVECRRTRLSSGAVIAAAGPNCGAPLRSRRCIEKSLSRLELTGAVAAEEQQPGHVSRTRCAHEPAQDYRRLHFDARRRPSVPRRQSQELVVRQRARRVAYPAAIAQRQAHDQCRQEERCDASLSHAGAVLSRRPPLRATLLSFERLRIGELAVGCHARALPALLLAEALDSRWRRHVAHEERGA